jgi:hypothetical protein
MPKPFQGVHLLDFIVRAPAPGGALPQVLHATYHFTVRHGVTVAVVPNDAESVHVFVAMNSVQYQPPDPPTAHDKNVPLTQLLESAGENPLSDFLEAGTLCTILGVLNPAAYAKCFYVIVMLTARGVETNYRDNPVPGSTLDSQNVVKNVEIDRLPGNAPQSIDDSQPFPVYGYLTLQWGPPAAVTNPGL